MDLPRLTDVTCTRLGLCVVVAVLGVGFSNCRQEPGKPNPGAQVFGKIPATLSRNWDKAWQTKSLADRIRPIDATGIAYVAKWNELDGFEEKPEPAILDSARRSALIKELETLPPPVRSYIERNVAAIFTTRALGGSAMAGLAYDDSGRPEFGFLIIDIDMFEKPANEWITAKELTLFAPDAKQTFSIQIEDSAANTSTAGMRFILLHELGHIASQLNHTMPPFTETNLSVDSDFAKLSWTSAEMTRFDSQFPERSRIKFYRRPPPFQMNSASAIYDHLGKTDIATLYSCVDPHEDFAETFVLYVHSVLMGKHYIVRLHDSAGEHVLAKDRILLSALAQKRKLVAEIFR
ncbi:MAG: hypothetical protein K8S54_17860 [Spirochaetia bacterium]|nr:hypothetical protein [Spirochaetia bacterium]